MLAPNVAVIERIGLIAMKSNAKLATMCGNQMRMIANTRVHVVVPPVLK